MFLYNLLQILNLIFIRLYSYDLYLIRFLFHRHTFSVVWSRVKIWCKFILRCFVDSAWTFLLFRFLRWDNNSIFKIFFCVNILPKVYSAGSWIETAFIAFMMLYPKFFFFNFYLFLSYIFCKFYFLFQFLFFFGNISFYCFV